MKALEIEIASSPPAATAPAPALLRPSSATEWGVARVYLLCLLLYALSFGSVVPTWPFVLRTLFLDPSTAAYFFGLIEASHSLAEFLCSPLLGRFSDCFGRRPLLLLSVSSKCVDLLLCLMALHFHSLALYWCGRFISGVVASFLSTVTAAVVDCSPQVLLQLFAPRTLH
jgi:DHA1 family tetracycline resistance protein-like MFS transporter